MIFAERNLLNVLMFVGYLHVHIYWVGVPPLLTYPAPLYISLLKFPNFFPKPQTFYRKFNMPARWLRNVMVWIFANFWSSPNNLYQNKLISNLDRQFRFYLSIISDLVLKLFERLMINFVSEMIKYLKLSYDAIRVV